MERYIGIDVHRDSSTICVLSATGKRVTREVVATNGHALVSSVRKLRGTLHICIEESTWSEWLYEILSPHASELVVYQNEWTPGAKSDAIDARGLAEKLRIGRAGPGVFKSPRRYRQLREWARVYRVMSQDAARAKNRLKSQFRRRGIQCSGTSVYDPRYRDQWLKQLPAAMRPPAKLLGLELDQVTELKAIFKGAAITAIHQTKAGHPLREAYNRLLEAGTRPPLARLTIARKIAATVLAMWKNEEVYRAMT